MIIINTLFDDFRNHDMIEESEERAAQNPLERCKMHKLTFFPLVMRITAALT